MASHATSHTHATDHKTGTGHAKVERNRVWRSAFASPLLYLLGSCLWLAGSAVNAREQPRTAFSLDGTGLFDVAGILFIVASSLWVLAALVSIVAAYSEVALLKVSGRTPGLGRLLILAAWHELLGSILLVVGSALWLGAGFNNTSAGAILWMIGSWIFLVGLLVLTIISMVVGSVTALMSEMLHRQRAWFSIASTVIFTTGMAFFTVGSAAYVVQRAPGFMLFGSLLWVLASALWVLSFFVRMCGAWYYFVPILSFATATAATSGLVAGTAAQPGVVGQPNAAAAGVESSKATSMTAHSSAAPPSTGVGMNSSTASTSAASSSSTGATVTMAGRDGLPPAATSEQVHVAV